jgi:hypothetical protein
MKGVVMKQFAATSLVLAFFATDSAAVPVKFEYNSSRDGPPNFFGMTIWIDPDLLGTTLAGLSISFDCYSCYFGRVFYRKNGVEIRQAEDWYVRDTRPAPTPFAFFGYPGDSISDGYVEFDSTGMPSRWSYYALDYAYTLYLSEGGANYSYTEPGYDWVTLYSVVGPGTWTRTPALPSPVPLPPGVLLFGTAIAALAATRLRRGKI